MALEDIADKVVDTDVLIVGGGMAGCGAAAIAKEYGLDVTIAEKAHTYRSGSAAAGLDHQQQLQQWPIKDWDGKNITMLDFLRRMENRNMVLNGYGRSTISSARAQSIIENRSLWTLEELEKLGISAKWDDGEYYFTPGAWTNGTMTMLRVHWNRIKPKLHAACVNRKVNILQRTQVTDLLTHNGRVVGATAVDVRTGEFIVIKAKVTTLATGMRLCRLYEPETPLIWRYQLRYHFCPGSMCGEGQAMAYRSGAEISNMEQTGWAFRIRDDPTISFGNFTWNDGLTAKYVTWDGEEFGYNNAPKYIELEQRGKTPVYNSIEHLPEDFTKRMEVAYADERMVSFKIAEDRGFDPKTHWYEMMKMKPVVPQGGIATEGNLMKVRGMEGLHFIGGTSGGINFGHVAQRVVSDAPEPVVNEAQLLSLKQTALAPLSVEDGTEPMELECAVRHVVERYVGLQRSEGKLREGLRRLGSLKREWLPKLMAKDPHYLMRAHECRNIMELAELHIEACMERKETRGNFIRLDYPERDRSQDNMITYQRLENGKPVLERRKSPTLTPEEAKKIAQMG